MNKVILMGRLTRDPEVRYSQGERAMAIARYTLAVDRRGRRSQDDGAQTADFIQCVAFDRAGEFAEKYFHQGTKVLVTGRIQTGSYTNRDGVKVYTTEVVVEELQEQANKKKIQISVSNDLDIKMMGNHTLLLRMMMNLVQNAISYGKEHGHIDILWKEQGDMIIGEVKDDGIGIDQEDIPKIWDRFYRVDKSRSRENGGTGLGLSMVHFIVAVHGGQIHVESKNGEGTSFIFQFPKM